MLEDSAGNRVSKAHERNRSAETVLPSDAGIRPVRQDPFSSYRAGFEVRTYRLCQRVLMFHHFADENNVAKDCLVRSTNFNYEFEDDPKVARAPIYSFLTSITQSGYVREGERYLKKSLPSVEFIYSMPEVQDLVEEVDPQSVENLPIGLDGTAYQWTDLHGRGIPGILTEQGGAWLCKRNWSPIPQQLPDGSEVVKAKFAAHETVALKPNVLLSDLRLRGLLGVGIPKELVQLMDRFAEGQVFFDQTSHAWTLRPATEITKRPLAGAESSMAVHFMDLADGRVVAYTTVRGKDGWEREGRILVGQLEGCAIQAGARILAEGFTEFLDRLVREEGRYYFDDPSFESKSLF